MFLILFVKKLNKELHFCINYWILNVIMIWNQYSIFLIQETLDQFLKTWFFTKLDIIHTFNQIHICEDDEKYTAFWTRWKLFEQFMMSFNLKNEFSIFQHYINNMLHEFLDVFVMIYINNILIYLNFLSEHQKHIQLILKQLWEADLQCDIWKYKFHANEVMYFDLIVFQEKIKMNSTKIEIIIN